MNKKHLVESLSRVLSTKTEAKASVDKIFAEIKKALKEGHKVVVSGFGSFTPFISRAKKGRNPKTGETIHLMPRRKVRFKQAKNLL
ncbi:MAG: HU family DNA-binding protein [Elusimicrobiota bacterium]